MGKVFECGRDSIEESIERKIVLVTLEIKSKGQANIRKGMGCFFRLLPLKIIIEIDPYFRKLYIALMNIKGEKSHIGGSRRKKKYGRGGCLLAGVGAYIVRHMYKDMVAQTKKILLGVRL